MRKFAIVIAIVTVLSVLMALPAAAGGTPTCAGSLPTQLTVGGRGQIDAEAEQQGYLLTSERTAMKEVRVLLRNPASGGCSC